MFTYAAILTRSLRIVENLTANIYWVLPCIIKYALMHYLISLILLVFLTTLYNHVITNIATTASHLQVRDKKQRSC